MLTFVVVVVIYQQLNLCWILLYEPQYWSEWKADYTYKLNCIFSVLLYILILPFTAFLLWFSLQVLTVHNLHRKIWVVSTEICTSPAVQKNNWLCSKIRVGSLLFLSVLRLTQSSLVYCVDPTMKSCCVMRCWIAAAHTRAFCTSAPRLMPQSVTPLYPTDRVLTHPWTSLKSLNFTIKR